jgi:hypothetical protein
MLDYPLFWGHFGTHGWGKPLHDRMRLRSSIHRRPAAAFLYFLPEPQVQESLRPTLSARGPKNHRPRLSSKHAPMKENIPTTPPIAIPTKNGGECAASPAFTKKWCSRCPKARVVNSTASPLKMLTIRMAVNSATQPAVVQALTRPLRRRRFRCRIIIIRAGLKK